MTQLQITDTITENSVWQHFVKTDLHPRVETILLHKYFFSTAQSGTAGAQKRSQHRKPHKLTSYSVHFTLIYVTERGPPYQFVQFLCLLGYFQWKYLTNNMADCVAQKVYALVLLSEILVP